MILCSQLYIKPIFPIFRTFRCLRSACMIGLSILLAVNSYAKSLPTHPLENIKGLEEKEDFRSNGMDTLPHPERPWIVGGIQTGLLVGSFFALNRAWYSQYPASDFHFFNDWAEWQQMDKLGHFWTAYQISRLSGDAWKWTGINEKKAVWIGGLSAVAYQSTIEILDGFSTEWGFSWGDMLFNISGAASYVSQELLWHDQRISIKMSYWPYDYPDDLKSRADDLFGTGPAERMLKDYNSQTYWLNVNLRSFFPNSRIPPWLNVSLGYGAELMLGGRENSWTDENGETVDRTDIARFRRFFLSADVDLTKIRTKSKFLKTVFSVVNILKIPAPALEWNTQGKFKLHALYY